MSKEDIYEKVKDIVAEELSIPTADVRSDSYLADDLGADSIDEVDILMRIEDEFNISVDENKLSPNFTTINDVVELIYEYPNVKEL